MDLNEAKKIVTSIAYSTDNQALQYSKLIKFINNIGHFMLHRMRKKLFFFLGII